MAYNIVYKLDHRNWYCFKKADFDLSIVFPQNTEPITGSPFDGQMFIAPECDTRGRDPYYNAFKADIYRNLFIIVFSK
jgi:hypothetical protein